MTALDRPVRYVLTPNGQQLSQQLAFFETPQATVLWWMGNDQELMDFLHEVARLTHNLVASVKTVVDHTRRTLNAAWPDKTNSIHREFEQAVKVFGEDPRLVVVQKLRNYVLHRELPGISGRLDLVPQEGAPMSSVRLTTANLLEWDGWGSTAKRYLEQAGDTIELRPLMAHYVEQAIALHQATLRSIQIHEKAVLDPWQTMAAEHDALAQEVRNRAMRPSSQVQESERAQAVSDQARDGVVAMHPQSDQGENGPSLAFAVICNEVVDDPDISGTQTIRHIIPGLKLTKPMSPSAPFVIEGREGHGLNLAVGVYDVPEGNHEIRLRAESPSGQVAAIDSVSISSADWLATVHFALRFTVTEEGKYNMRVFLDDTHIATVPLVLGH